MANIKNPEYDNLQEAVDSLTEVALELGNEYYMRVAVNAQDALNNITERRLKNNQRTLTAINQRRKTNKNYAR